MKRIVLGFFVEVFRLFVILAFYFFFRGFSCYVCEMGVIVFFS